MLLDQKINTFINITIDCVALLDNVLQDIHFNKISY